MSRISGISAKSVNKLPSDIDSHLYKLLQTKATSGWYDQNKDCVYVYEPNVTSDGIDIMNKVVFIKTRAKGLKGLMGERYDEFCTECLRDFGYDPEILRDSQLDPNVAKRACQRLRLNTSEKVINAIINGQKSYLKNQQWEARRDNNHEIVNQAAVESLRKVADDNINVSLGHCSDPFLRIGYPETELQIKSKSVRAFLMDNGFLNEEAHNFTSLIQNPVAIIRGEINKDNDRIPMNIVVTDLYQEDKGFLSFGIDAPETILAGYSQGKKKVKVNSAKYMSDYALLCAMSGNNGENIRYLKSGKTYGYEISSYLRKMEGRSDAELGKKSGNGNAPVVLPFRESRRLNLVTNIVENFKNPMESDKRKKIFGGILFDDALRKREELKKEMKTLSHAPVIGSKKPQPQCKLSSARTTYLTEKDFTQGALKKLRANKVYSAYDIITYGKDRFVSDFGTRAFKSAVTFLDKHNLSFLNHSIIKRIDEMELIGKDFDGKCLIVQKDMYNTLSGFNEDNISKPIHFPHRLDGSYLKGAGSLTMMAKSMEMARWRECNVFLTRTEAEKMNIQINRAAVPTYIVEKEEVLAYYNLSETSFAMEKPESFSMLKSDALNKTPLVDDYAKRYIILLSGPGDPNYRLDLIDQAFERQYSGNRHLENKDSFVEYLNKSISERLSETFDDGFVKGKAEGINFMANVRPDQEQTEKKVKVQSKHSVKYV